MGTLKIFCSYAPADRGLMESFYAHLRGLAPQRVSIWYARDNLPTTQWEQERDRQLNAAQLILLLVSSDFINAGGQCAKEVSLAMQHHATGEAHVIPVILRSVHWQEQPFGKLSPLPTDGRVATDEKSWQSLDHAFFDTVSEIKRVIDDLRSRQSAQQEDPDSGSPDPAEPSHTPTEIVAQLDQLIQGFRQLRGQIASFARLRGEPGFSVEVCENRYNRLYGDTMVFLATYQPERLSDDEDGFVTVVYRKAQEQLRKRADPFVIFTRMVIAPLARFEKVAEQIDACVATLEFYKQKYFSASTS